MDTQFPIEPEKDSIMACRSFRGPFIGIRKMFHHRSIDQIRKGKNSIPLFRQTRKDPLDFRNPFFGPILTTRQDIMQQNDIPGADLPQNDLRQTPNPPVAPVKGATAEVDTIHAELLQDSRQLRIRDPDGGPKDQRTDAVSRKHILSQRNFLAERCP